MSRLALDMTAAAGKAAPHFPKNRRRFLAFRVFNSAHEKDYSASCRAAAADDRGYNDCAA